MVSSFLECCLLCLVYIALIHPKKKKAIHFGKYVHGTCSQQMGHMSLELGDGYHKIANPLSKYRNHKSECIPITCQVVVVNGLVSPFPLCPNLMGKKHSSKLYFPFNSKYSASRLSLLIMYTETKGLAV